MVAPAAGVATPLLGPAALAVVPLRYVTPSDSSETVPRTRISRVLKIEMRRKPAKTVSKRLSLERRLARFQSAPSSTSWYAASNSSSLSTGQQSAIISTSKLTVTVQHAESSDHREQSYNCCVAGPEPLHHSNKLVSATQKCHERLIGRVQQYALPRSDQLPQGTEQRPRKTESAGIGQLRAYSRVSVRIQNRLDTVTHPPLKLYSAAAVICGVFGCKVRDTF